jgi:HTH-type transcriptional regulator/antitoxin HigA
LIITSFNAIKGGGITMEKSHSYIAIPPGATIKEQLLDRGLSQKEFAVRMGMSEKHISKLINGEVQLTCEVAVKLEMVLGVPAKFWNNLEAIYREKIIKVKFENEMDEDIKIAKKMPYAEMAKRKWIPKESKATDKVIDLRKYFEVVRLKSLENNQINRIACRRVAETEKGDFALIAWAQKAKLEARKIETEQIDLKTLKKYIPVIRKMTTKDPSYFCPELIKMLAKCGIAIVFLPHIGGSFLHGATFYDGKKIVVGLTVRGKDADKFWFSLFHELAHILHGHINNPNGTTDKDEKDADLFARDTLIPTDSFSSFVKKKDFRESSIASFAQSVEIDSGIVVVRLQKEGYIKYNWLNKLKTKYSISA